MEIKIYSTDLEDIIYESGNIQYHSDKVGIGEFKFDINYKKNNYWYQEIVFDDFKISYAKISFSEKTTISFEFEFKEDAVEMYFPIKGNSLVSMDTFHDNFSIGSNSHNILYRNVFQNKIECNSSKMFFFKVNLKPSFFKQYLPDSEQFSDFKKLICSKKPGIMSSHNHTTTLEMSTVINNIIYCPLKNEFRKLFIESKVLELLLLQLNQMHKCEYCFVNANVSKNIIDKMYLARDIIAEKLNNPMSLSNLAKMVSTNECTLKKEFKKVFGATVFGYIGNAKMEKAKKLLLDENLSISEISDIIGYKNPQHFTTAFKKKYGVPPSFSRN